MTGTMEAALFWPGSSGQGALPQPESRIRRESRQRVVRMVEHSPFPRAHAGEGRAVAFTRDLSASGICLGVERLEAEGSLLHVTVHGLDGRPSLRSIARVTRCEQDARGRLWLGLSLVDPHPTPAALPKPRLLSVRPTHANGQLATA